MRQDRSSLNRAASGALPATSLLLLVVCGPSLASATDIRCQRSASIDELPDRLYVDMVELARDADTGAADAALRQGLSRQPASVTPDLSSRARSMAILREIFGEPVSNDRVDVARMPPQDLADGLEDRQRAMPLTETYGDDLSLQQPAAGVTENDPPSLQAPQDEDAEVPDSDARLPGVSDEENLRFRQQMYRTDI